MTEAACGAAAMGLGARLRAADAVQERLGEFPLAGVVTQFREDQARRGTRFSPTGVTRDGYLRLIAGIVGFFAGHQDARGAIVDPYERAEKQY